MKEIELICDYCNKKIKRAFSEYKRCIKKGIKNTFCDRSCSCAFNNKKHPRKNNKYLISNNRKDEFTKFRYFIKTAKARDKKKNNLSGMNLNLKYLKTLWEEQKGICPITGWKLVLPINVDNWEIPHNPKNASLDRIDPLKRYIKGNVRFVAFIANMAKSVFTDDIVIDFCRNVVNYQNKK